jgi:hypothetical protein
MRPLAHPALALATRRRRSSGVRGTTGAGGAKAPRGHGARGAAAGARPSGRPDWTAVCCRRLGATGCWLLRCGARDRSAHPLARRSAGPCVPPRARPAGPARRARGWEAWVLGCWLGVWASTVAGLAGARVGSHGVQGGMGCGVCGWGGGGGGCCCATEWKGAPTLPPPPPPGEAPVKRGGWRWPHGCAPGAAPEPLRTLQKTGNTPRPHPPPPPGACAAPSARRRRHEAVVRGPVTRPATRRARRPARWGRPEPVRGAAGTL